MTKVNDAQIEHVTRYIQSLLFLAQAHKHANNFDLAVEMLHRRINITQTRVTEEQKMYNTHVNSYIEMGQAYLAHAEELSLNNEDDPLCDLKYMAANSCFEQALILNADHLNNPENLYSALINKSIVYDTGLCDTIKQIQIIKQALKAGLTSVNFPNLFQYALSNLALAYAKLRKFDRAQSCFQQEEEICRKKRLLRDLALCYQNQFYCKLQYEADPVGALERLKILIEFVESRLPSDEGLKEGIRANQASLERLRKSRRELKDNWRKFWTRNGAAWKAVFSTDQIQKRHSCFQAARELGIMIDAVNSDVRLSFKLAEWSLVFIGGAPEAQRCIDTQVDDSVTSLDVKWHAELYGIYEILDQVEEIHRNASQEHAEITAWAVEAWGNQLKDARHSQKAVDALKKARVLLERTLESAINAGEDTQRLKQKRVQVALVACNLSGAMEDVWDEQQLRAGDSEESQEPGPVAESEELQEAGRLQELSLQLLRDAYGGEDNQLMRVPLRNLAMFYGRQSDSEEAIRRRQQCIEDLKALDTKLSREEDQGDEEMQREEDPVTGDGHSNESPKLQSDHESTDSEVFKDSMVFLGGESSESSQPASNLTKQTSNRLRKRARSPSRRSRIALWNEALEDERAHPQSRIHIDLLHALMDDSPPPRKRARRRPIASTARQRQQPSEPPHGRRARNGRSNVLTVVDSGSPMHVSVLDDDDDCDAPVVNDHNNANTEPAPVLHQIACADASKHTAIRLSVDRAQRHLLQYLTFQILPNSSRYRVAVSAGTTVDDAKQRLQKLLHEEALERSARERSANESNNNTTALTSWMPACTIRQLCALTAEGSREVLHPTDEILNVCPMGSVVLAECEGVPHTSLPALYCLVAPMHSSIHSQAIASRLASPRPASTFKDWSPRWATKPAGTNPCNNCQTVVNNMSCDDLVRNEDEQQVLVGGCDLRDGVGRALLETVARCAQVLCLDLSRCRLDDCLGHILCDLLATQLPSLKCLNVSQNPLHPTTIDRLVRTLTLVSAPTLTALDLSYLPVFPTAETNFAALLSGPSCSLSCVRLCSTNMRARSLSSTPFLPAGAMVPVAPASQNSLFSSPNLHLVDLDVSLNPLGWSGLIELWSLINRAIPLARFKASDVGAIGGELDRDKPLATIEILNLSGNRLAANTTGEGWFLPRWVSVAPQSSVVQDVDVSRCGLLPQSVASLLRALAPTAVRRVVLSNNTIGELGVSVLVERIGPQLSMFASLDELHLSQCGMTMSDCVRVLQAICTSSVRYLNLSGNSSRSFTHDEALLQRLKAAVSAAKGVECIDLSHNCLSESFVQDIAQHNGSGAVSRRVLQMVRVMRGAPNIFWNWNLNPISQRTFPLEIVVTMVDLLSLSHSDFMHIGRWLVLVSLQLGGNIQLTPRCHTIWRSKPELLDLLERYSGATLGDVIDPNIDEKSDAFGGALLGPCFGCEVRRSGVQVPAVKGHVLAEARMRNVGTGNIRCRYIAAILELCRCFKHHGGGTHDRGQVSDGANVGVKVQSGALGAVIAILKQPNISDTQMWQMRFEPSEIRCHLGCPRPTPVSTTQPQSDSDRT
eukprot:c20700_g1_i2.p1 GENE.c20700_g1_i2~~c20700_g1_i2.p1  ORF type:complete len:1575 (+),score=228.28 c20700_g1_i2:243-4967(+)